jgi:hypothetical protein
MTRTTDLLKRIEEHEKRTSCMYVTGRNELKGRLDALKEEEKFLDELGWVINGNVTLELQKYVNKELASIQEEIKLIESAGVGK